jgi:hypothetical protein
VFLRRYPIARIFVICYMVSSNPVTYIVIHITLGIHRSMIFTLFMTLVYLKPHKYVYLLHVSDMSIDEYLLGYMLSVNNLNGLKISLVQSQCKL